MKRWVLFFDGGCGLCSAAVRRVARYDKRGCIDFAPLQGKLAGEMDLGKYAAADDGTLVVQRESDGRIFLRSDALLEIAHALGGPWRVFTIFRLIPKPLRDWAYRQIANRRHLFFKKTDHCSLPDPELVRRLRE